MASSSSSSSLLFVVAVMAMALAAAAVAGDDLPQGRGMMSIHNDFPSKLYVACNSDREQQPVDMVRAQAAHRFMFDAGDDRFWMCTIKTTPMTDYPYTPVPAVWGRFAVYVRNPAFRACYPMCDWKADAEGLWLVAHPGDQPKRIYTWTKQ